MATTTYLTVTTSISDQKNQRQHAEDVRPIDCERMRADEALLHRVERRRADVAEHHADRAEHQLGQRFFGAMRCALPRRRRPLR